MKILFVSHSGRRSGGAQNVMFALIKHLMKMGIECHCIFPEHGRFYDEMVEYGVICHRVKFSWWAGFEMDTLYKIIKYFLTVHSSTNEFVNIINKHNINLVISNTITMSEGALAARLCKIPHIWYVHEILSQDPKLKHMIKIEFLYPIMLQLSEKIVVVSNAVKQEFIKYLGYDSDKIEVVYNGVVTPNSPPASLVGYNVLSVGGICRRKGQYTLLKSAEIVINVIPKARFPLAGMFWEKEYSHLLLEERVRMGIERKFSFNKWTVDMDAYYQSGAVLVSPSTVEAFGLSMLEGMAHGLPVVTTDSGGPSEIVVEGETGFIVPVNDEVRMAERTLRLLENKELAKKMGLAGRKRVAEFFSQDKFVNEFTNIIMGREVAIGNT